GQKTLFRRQLGETDPSMAFRAERAALVYPRQTSSKRFGRSLPACNADTTSSSSARQRVMCSAARAASFRRLTSYCVRELLTLPSEGSKAPWIASVQRT